MKTSLEKRTICLAVVDDCFMSSKIKQNDLISYNLGGKLGRLYNYERHRYTEKIMRSLN